MTGPLAGIRAIELGGLGPAPFCAMVLADLGAEVLRIERPGKVPPAETVAVHDDLVAHDVLSRGRRSAAIDLRHPAGAELVARLSEQADVFVEGFRPGVAERLGVGPDEICGRAPRLVYGRMTGWGRDGSLADEPGHDINYLALAGVLAHVGREGQPPTPPLNLVADFGGGGMLLALGVCAALVERAASGRGQVVDAAMIDGAALLMAPLFGASQSGYWSERRGTNLLDSGAPFYDSYACADGRHVAVGAIEPAFFAGLVEGLGLDPAWCDRQNDPAHWPSLRAALERAFATRSRDEWAEHFEHRGACVTPVLTMAEAPGHPHHRARGTFVDVGGALQPGPAPRFSRTPAAVEMPPRRAGADTDAVLAAWGVDAAERQRLRQEGVIA